MKKLTLELEMQLGKDYLDEWDRLDLFDCGYVIEDILINTFERKSVLDRLRNGE